MKKYIAFLFMVTVSVISLSAQDWTSVNVTSGNVPLGALVAGVDTDGSPLYIARRVNAAGSLVIGKFSPKAKLAWFPYGGVEEGVSSGTVEVFTGFGVWVKGSSKSVPTGVITAGNEADGSPLYIIRAKYKGVCVGKFSTANKYGYISYGGKEVSLTENLFFLVSDNMPEAK